MISGGASWSSLSSSSSPDIGSSFSGIESSWEKIYFFKAENNAPIDNNYYSIYVNTKMEILH